MSNEEKEIKILLSEKEYKLIDDLFEWSKNYVQVNHYYGTETDIFNKTNTYRVREKNGKKLIQVKIPMFYDGSLHIKKEYEKEISYVPDHLSNKILKEMTGKDFYEDLPYIGKLITRRKECLVNEDIEICLDKNSYLDQTDYELEIEFKGKYPEKIISILKEHNIKTQNVVLGKNARFFVAYREKNI